MTATVAGIHLGPDTHANRPAAGTPPVGSLYSCTTHSLVYRTDGATWSTYASAITAAGAVSTDTIWDAKGDLAAGTAADTASKLTVGANDTVLTADSAQSTGLKWAATLGAWTTYTPTLTATTTNPTLGSSVLTGRYKALDSKTYIINIYYEVVTGGAFNVGSGNYQFLLPNSVTSGAVDQMLTAHLLDSSGPANFLGVGLVTASQTLVLRTYVEGTEAVTHSSPFAWANGDKLHITGIIEVA